MRSFVLSVLSVLAVAAPAPAAQTFLHVPAQHPTIQAGLDAAQPGDVVIVAEGIYPERVLLREGVNLVGSGWSTTVIDAGGIGSPVSADLVHVFGLDGFTLRGSAPDAAGLSIRGTSLMTFGVTAAVTRCRLVDNGGGVRIVDVHSGILTLRENTIDRNAGHGVDTFLGATILERNTIAGNGGNGVHLVDGAGLNFLTTNAIVFNAGHGVLRTPTTPVLAFHNDVYGNVSGQYAEMIAGLPVGFAPTPGNGEISVDPHFVAWENGDYHPLAGSPLIDAGHPLLPPDLDGTLPDIGALPFLASYVPASIPYGAGCGPTAGWFGEPILGQPYFEVHVAGGAPGLPAVLVTGVSPTTWSGIPLPLDLGFVGAPGCALLLGPVLSFPHVADGAGHAQMAIAIPDDPVLGGAKLYFQWMTAAPGANPLGLTFSPGVAATIQP